MLQDCIERGQDHHGKNKEGLRILIERKDLLAMLKERIELEG
jgi:hypothetical protein